LLYPVSKIAEKAVCRSAFLTMMALYFECRINKSALLETAFLAILLTGYVSSYCNLLSRLPSFRILPLGIDTC